jgi:hypothetical protein
MHFSGETTKPRNREVEKLKKANPSTTGWLAGSCVESTQDDDHSPGAIFTTK